MAALAADRNTRMRAQLARHRRCGVGAVKVYKGGIACKNAAGFLVPASDAAGLTVVGVFEETIDNSGGSAGDLSAGYATGADFEFVNAAGAVVQATQKCTAADDQSVTTAAVTSHDVFVGIVTEFSTTLVWVYIDEQSSVAGS